MIAYDPDNWAKLIVRFRGSIVSHVVEQAFLGGLIGIIAKIIFDRSSFELASSVHLYLTQTLALVLVFRTQISYERYWNGRLQIARVEANAKKLVLHSSTLCDGDDRHNVEERARILRHLNLMFAVIIQELRSEDDSQTLIEENILQQDEFERLKNCDHRPSVIATWISKTIHEMTRRGAVSEQRFGLLYNCVREILHAWTEMDAMVKTPLAFPYAQLIKTWMFLYTATLPFVFATLYGWWTPVLSALASVLVYGIDEIGVIIENPFGHEKNDLPLTGIRQMMNRNLMILLNQRDKQDELVEELKSELFEETDGARRKAAEEEDDFDENEFKYVQHRRYIARIFGNVMRFAGKKR